MNKIKEQDILDKSKLSLGRLFGDDIKIKDNSFSNKHLLVDGYLLVNDKKFPYVIISNPNISKFINIYKDFTLSNNTNIVKIILIKNYCLFLITRPKII